VRVGEHAFTAQTALEKRGVYPEFCDGESICFYLSPATTKRAFRVLKRSIAWLCKTFTLNEEKGVQRIHTPLVTVESGETEWVDLDQATGRICAMDCGLFPPCTPLIGKGERVLAQHVRLLQSAPNVYGLVDGKMKIYK
jgi:arginine/lysine/ornithine decarboxylase